MVEKCLEVKDSSGNPLENDFYFNPRAKIVLYFGGEYNNQGFPIFQSPIGNLSYVPKGVSDFERIHTPRSHVVSLRRDANWLESKLAEAQKSKLEETTQHPSGLMKFWDSIEDHLSTTRDKGKTRKYLLGS